MDSFERGGEVAVSVGLAWLFGLEATLSGRRWKSINAKVAKVAKVAKDCELKLQIL